jgi:predicted membrane protein
MHETLYQKQYFSLLDFYWICSTTANYLFTLISPSRTMMLYGVLYFLMMFFFRSWFLSFSTSSLYCCRRRRSRSHSFIALILIGIIFIEWAVQLSTLDTSCTIFSGVKLVTHFSSLSNSKTKQKIHICKKREKTRVSRHMKKIESKWLMRFSYSLSLFTGIGPSS